MAGDRPARSWAAVVTVVLIAAAALAPSGQSPGQPPPVVTWSLAVPTAAPAGASFKVTLTATVTPGWKIYAMDQTAEGPRPLKISAGSSAFAVDGAVAPDTPATTVKDTIWEAIVSYHERTTTFAVPLRAKPTTMGDSTIRLTVRYQACSNELCLRPTEVTLEKPTLVR